MPIKDIFLNNDNLKLENVLSDLMQECVLKIAAISKFNLSVGGNVMSRYFIF